MTSEGDAAPPSGKEASGNRNRLGNGPLWMFAALLGVTDAGLAYVAGTTDGSIQTAVLAFLALYTCALAATFLFILWHRPWVLYPPSAFSFPNVGEYVAAMQGNPVHADRLAREVGNELSPEGPFGQRLSDATADLRPDQQKAVLDVANRTRAEVIDRIKSTAVYVDPSPLKGEAWTLLELAYEPETPGRRFADQILWRLQPFPPYAYGTKWALRVKETGVVLAGLDHTVRDAGIVGGMVLEVIDPSREERGTRRIAARKERSS